MWQIIFADTTLHLMHSLVPNHLLVILKLSLAHHLCFVGLNSLFSCPITILFHPVYQ